MATSVPTFGYPDTHFRSTGKEDLNVEEELGCVVLFFWLEAEVGAAETDVQRAYFLRDLLCVTLLSAGIWVVL